MNICVQSRRYHLHVHHLVYTSVIPLLYQLCTTMYMSFIHIFLIIRTRDEKSQTQNARQIQTKRKNNRRPRTARHSPRATACCATSLHEVGEIRASRLSCLADAWRARGAARRAPTRRAGGTHSGSGFSMAHCGGTRGGQPGGWRLRRQRSARR